MRDIHNEQSASAAPFSRRRGNSFEAFDQLPPAVRAAMHEAVVDWCPLEIQKQLRKARRLGIPDDVVIPLLAKSFSAADQREIAEFDLNSPHLCARATLQRYGKREAAR